MKPFARIAKAIGQQIRHYRRLCHITQAKLANLLHLSRQIISRYETGRATLAAYRIPDLCRVLNITPNEFFALPSLDIVDPSIVPQPPRRRNSARSPAR